LTKVLDSPPVLRKRTEKPEKRLMASHGRKKKEVETQDSCRHVTKYPGARVCSAHAASSLNKTVRRGWEGRSKQGTHLSSNRRRRKPTEGWVGTYRR